MKIRNLHCKALLKYWCIAIFNTPLNLAHLQHVHIVLLFYGTARSVYEIARLWVHRELS